MQLVSKNTCSPELMGSGLEELGNTTAKVDVRDPCNAGCQFENLEHHKLCY